jgi:hypothetical protein
LVFAQASLRELFRSSFSPFTALIYARRTSLDPFVFDETTFREVGLFTTRRADDDPPEPPPEKNDLIRCQMVLFAID